eukprot:NODE_343_length_1844_cov_70.293593_g249_i0.p1 GENE.NODE_343_length_1844_cov_70.293593_g249_i0~~NODE_343_length_1844_cov_70.293593_g249_i0.p1  ORF type:complete len:421 (+),score=75.70 NODE_343_length_1844_cov_70.293593_g249_i0:578-1840(+)
MPPTTYLLQVPATATHWKVGSPPAYYHGPRNIRTPLDMPLPRSRQGSVIVNGMLLMFDGDTALGTGHGVWAIHFNEPSRRWKRLAIAGPEPEPRTDYETHVYKDKVVLFFGRLGEVLYGDVHILHLGAQLRWEPAVTAVTTGLAILPRAGCGSVLLGDGIYLQGGWMGQGVRDTNLYHLALAQAPLMFTKLLVQGIPPATAFHAMVTFNDVLYTYGGFECAELAACFWPCEGCMSTALHGLDLTQLVLRWVRVETDRELAGQSVGTFVVVNGLGYSVHANYKKNHIIQVLDLTTDPVHVSTLQVDAPRRLDYTDGGRVVADGTTLHTVGGYWVYSRKHTNTISEFHLVGKPTVTHVLGCTGSDPKLVHGCPDGTTLTLVGKHFGGSQTSQLFFTRTATAPHPSLRYFHEDFETHSPCTLR